ncbi:tyrosine-type recombinase/integrase [Pedococcus sp. 2YAF34]|uniref:tyrosine-type recombinase/integrase n=1 Tax=Pedococcus sp. 2YAF34 TaxID=3233032 RepID=UPI003F9CCE31
MTCHRGNTREAYRRDLADFLRHCARLGIDPLQARRVHLARYLEDCERQALAPATIARRLTALKGFYRYCHDEGHLSSDPSARVVYRRQRSQTRLRALSTDELAAFLQAADQHSPRAAALAWLLATTGLRISEACTARLEDLRPSADGIWLDVICKGGVRRTVPVLTPVLTRIRTLHGQTATGPVFATRTGAALDRHAAARTLRRVAGSVGVHPFSPHVLRHTFVTLARAHGCALEDVQEAAGHADPATTRRYDRTVVGTATHPGLPLIAALLRQARDLEAAPASAFHPTGG